MACANPFSFGIDLYLTQWTNS